MLTNVTLGWPEVYIFSSAAFSKTFRVTLKLGDGFRYPAVVVTNHVGRNIEGDNTRSTSGSNANATAGGKSRHRATDRLGIWSVRNHSRLVARRIGDAWASPNVTVEEKNPEKNSPLVGMTVLLRRSLLV